MLARIFRPDRAMLSWGIPLLYACFAGLWILLSDLLLERLLTKPADLALASMLKGWLFVAVTTLLLYAVLRRRRVSSEQSDDAGMSRRYLIPASLLCLGILLLAFFGVMHTFDHQRDKAVARIQAIADFKRQQIADWLHERRDNAEFMRESVYTVERYRIWQEKKQDRAREEIVKRLNEILRVGGFNGASLLSRQGERLLAVGDAPEKFDEPTKKALAKALSSGEILRVDPYLASDSSLRLDFIVPINGDRGDEPVIIWHVLPDKWLYPALRSWPMASDTGESLLFVRDGEEVIFLSDLRHQASAVGMFRKPLATPNLLSARVLRGADAEGVVLQGEDYRGEAVIGIVHAIPDSSWFLLVKNDVQEIQREAVKSAAWIGLAALLAMLMTGTALYQLQQQGRLSALRATQQAQSERLRALQLLAAIADGSEDAIFAKDRDGRYLLFNRAATRYSGRKSSEIIGHDDFVIFPPAQAGMLREIDLKVMESRTTRCDEATFDTFEGPRVFQFTTGPLIGEKGEILGVFGISRDITERQKNEMALRESESRFRALVEQALVGIYIIQQGRFRYVNPRFAAIFGYATVEEIVDRIDAIDMVHSANRAWVAESLQRRLNGEESSAQYSFTGLRRDGSEIVVEVHGQISEYQSRPAIVGVVMDITVREAVTRALGQKASELEQRNAELARINRAMVGRELDMIELKRRINAMACRLGETAPFALDFCSDTVRKEGK